MDIAASDLNLVGKDLGWGPLEANSLVTPCFASLPMGFTWSLYFCQVTAEDHVPRAPGMAHSVRMHDKGGALILRVCRTGCKEPNFVAHYVYVDNIGIFSIGAARTRVLLGKVMTHFGGLGLEMHEVEVFEHFGEALGSRLCLADFGSALSKK